MNRLPERDAVLFVRVFGRDREHTAVLILDVIFVVLRSDQLNLAQNQDQQDVPEIKRNHTFAM